MTQSHASPVTVDVVLMPTPTTLLDDALAREMLSHDELDRAARFVRMQDALAFRSSRALLRLVLGSRLGLSPEALKFTRSSCRRCGGPHGKPIVGGPLRFSFSQTADLSGVAIGSSDVGFDVETMITDVAAREIESALSVDEQTHLRSANDRGATATTIWVRKEAALKCTGDGITADLRGFSVFDNPVVLSDVAVWIADLPSQHGAAAAVASSVGPPHAQITVLGPDQIEALLAQVRG